jgi:glucose/arabinose dehydrogenase
VTSKFRHHARTRIAVSALAAALACASGAAAGDRHAQAGAAVAATEAAEAAKTGGGRGGIGLKRVGRFRAPTYVAGAPGEKGVFVVEQAGRIRLLRRGKRRTFLDIRGKVLIGGEQGLLSVAFAPDYRTSGFLYVFYVTNGGDLAIEEYRRDSAKRAAPGSARRVLTIDHPGESNHNGGQVAFGPDGLLYAGTGDGGGAGDTSDNAQDVDSLLGKLLRIDPRPSSGQPYRSPGSNPFAGRAGRDEVYAVGLRNPYRFSFDGASGKGTRIAIGDVGQNRFEEIDYEKLGAANGANFGWNDFEGFSTFDGAHAPAPSRHDRPIKVYGLGGGGCAVIGGYVSAARELASIRGRYVYGDFCLGQIRSLVPKLGRARKDRRLGVRVPMLSSFGRGPGGSLYATSLNGPVFKLVGKRRKR